MVQAGHRRRHAWLLLTICVAGCSTYSQRVTAVRDAYYRNDLVAASELIDDSLRKPRGDADLLQLERAMILLAQGRPAEAEVALRTARDRFDHFEQKDAAELTLSYMTDDQRRAYAGEDYEKVLIRSFLALSNLLQDGGDAEAYSLQAIDKQERIILAGGDTAEENPKLKYPRVALAPYLHAVLREATHRDYEDASRSYASVVSWQPDFDAAAGDLQRARYGRHSQPGCGVLYVFVLTGRGPYKQEAVEVPSSAALFMAGEIVSHVAEQSVPPNVAPVKVSRIVARHNAIRSVAVSVNGWKAGQTSTITDVTSLAVAQHEAVLPQLVARAVARRVLKKGVVYGAKQAADIAKGSLPSLAFDVAGVAWEATERADTRCWGLLPDKIQVLRIELEAGMHELQLQPILDNRAGAVGRVQRTVPIADGRNTYVLAAFPDRDLIGEPLITSSY